jgi:glycosyltransferase involved in cell wall biosynthesis
LRLLPAKLREISGTRIRKLSLMALARFYHIPRMLFAPNSELIDLLRELTGKECHLMSRGVDVDLFSPERRSRGIGPFTIGYVGRITVEKNVELLADLEKELLCAGIAGFRFLIVGQGASAPRLKKQLMHADFTGVLHGERLAEAYANMDVFVFPSRTDTFGNVVLEAMASGVPSIVSDEGGPKNIVQHGRTGFVATARRDFPRYVFDLMNDSEKLRSMSKAARIYALEQSWDTVFDSVYQKYSQMLACCQAPSENLRMVRPDFFRAGAPW